MRSRREAVYGAAVTGVSHHTAIHMFKVFEDVLLTILGSINIFYGCLKSFTNLPFTNTIGLIHLTFRYIQVIF